MNDDITKLIEKAVAKALAGDMDMINAIEDRVTRSKAKAALVKAKRAANMVAASETKAVPPTAETESAVSEISLSRKVIQSIEKKFPGSLDGESGNNHIQLKGENWLNIARYLKDFPDYLFDSLQCVTGVDLGEEDDLEVRYNLHSMTFNHAIEIRISTPRNHPLIPSIEPVWRIGDWFERETYDMYGILFDGHHNLERILLPEDWEGWPLRRDYETQETYHGIPVIKLKEGWE